MSLFEPPLNPMEEIFRKVGQDLARSMDRQVEELMKRNGIFLPRSAEELRKMGYVLIHEIERTGNFPNQEEKHTWTLAKIVDSQNFSINHNVTVKL